MDGSQLDISGISPLVIHCHTFPEDFAFTMENFPKLAVRKIYDYELELILSDGGTMMVGGKDYPMRRGTVFFRRPGEYTNGKDPFHACSLIVDMSPAEGAAGQIYGSDYYTMQKSPQKDYQNHLINTILSCTYSENHSRMIHLFDKIRTEYKEQKPQTPLLLRSYVLEILCHLYDHATTAGKTGREELLSYHRSVLRGIRHIDMNLSGALSVRQLAEMNNLNVDYFSRVFTASTGKTPSQYILQARLRKARELIIYTALPIYAIAEECGFQSPSYFTSRFRQMFGIAPQAYRKRFE